MRVHGMSLQNAGALRLPCSGTAICARSPKSVHRYRSPAASNGLRWCSWMNESEVCAGGRLRVQRSVARAMAPVSGPAWAAITTSSEVRMLERPVAWVKPPLVEPPKLATATHKSREWSQLNVERVPLSEDAVSGYTIGLGNRPDG